MVPDSTSEEINPSLSQQLFADINPMLNPVVLACLFEVCDLSDLRRFRLVSKQWHSISLTRFRKEMTVLILSGRGRYVEEDEEFLALSQETRLYWMTLKEELELGTKLFRRFYFSNIEFGGLPPPYTHPDFDRQDLDLPPPERSQLDYWKRERFWGMNGKWIQKLELTNCVVHDRDAFRKIVFEYTPNLMELVLKHVRTTVGVDDEGGEGVVVTPQPNLKSLCVWQKTPMPISWRLIFLHFTNIQDLELQYHDSLKGFRPLVEALEMVSNEEKKSKMASKLVIRKFKLESIMHEAEDQNQELVRRFLHLPQVKLSALHLDGAGCESAQGNMLSTTIQHHRHTLKKLCIKNCGCYMASQVPGPYDNFPFQSDPPLILTKLNMNASLCRNFHFLEHLPNLRRLKVTRSFDQDILNGTDLTRMGKLVLPNMQALHFEDLFVSPEGMEMFGKLMPNLEYLKTWLNTPVFRVICENWRKLKVLEIGSGCVDVGCYEDVVPRQDVLGDEGLTGIVAGSEERLPNITDLKYLQKLRIDSTKYFSEVSVRDGFLQLPHLNSIFVRLPLKVSEEKFSALVEKCSGSKRITRDSRTSVAVAAEIEDTA